MLLRKNADTGIKNNAGQTAQDAAVQHNFPAIALLVQNYPAKEKDCYVTRYLSKSGEMLPHDDTNGLPQLLVNQFVTFAHFDLERTKKMLGQVPGLLLTRSAWNELPVEGCAHLGFEAIVNFLLDKGAPLSICTALMLGMTGTVKKMFADEPANLYARGAHDYPLFWYTAIGKPKIDLAEMLLAKGADVNQNIRGHSALYECAFRGHAEMAEYLIEKGADARMRSLSGFMTGTPFEIATRRKHDNVLAVLKKYGVNE
jgi:ankyrin repeat protein